MPFWDERFNAMKENYPDIETDQYHIDILVARFVLNPEWLDVVVASNLFGDILSDLGPACTGTIELLHLETLILKINFHLYLNQFMVQRLILQEKVLLILLDKFGLVQ